MFGASGMPKLPTMIIPTKIRWLKPSGKFPRDVRFSLLKLKILRESNPLKVCILVRRLAVAQVHSAESPGPRNSTHQGNLS